jgi:hypothetical protein
VKVRIDTIRLPPEEGQDEADSLPFVHTTPALPGLRINSALYRGLAGMEAPASPRSEDVRAVLSKRPEPPLGGEPSRDTIEAFVLWLPPRACSCSRWIPEAARRAAGITVNGACSICAPATAWSRTICLPATDKLRQREEAWATPDSLAAFEDCLEKKWRPKGAGQIVWLEDKRWLVRGPVCTLVGDALPPPIDSQSFPLKALAPYLSHYGKSLLLGNGDMRTLEKPVIRPACRRTRKIGLRA